MAQDEKQQDHKYLKDFEVGQEIIKENGVCADCDTKDPTWAVLNHGVLICIECAGVHRSLGAHISKVRSIDGDKWNNDMINEMCKSNNSTKIPSNKEYNKIAEYFVNSKESKYYKPKSNSSRDLRNKYIKAKYELKLFSKNNQKNENKEASYPLFDANPNGKNENNSKNGNKNGKEQGMIQTTGIVDLLFMNATDLPIADVAMVGGKSDPYVICFQSKQLKTDKDRKKFGTQIKESTVNPIWVTEKDKEYLDKGQLPPNNKDLKKISLTVNENEVVSIEVWDHDSMSNDDLMCTAQLDILKECPQSDKEYKIVKQLKVVPEFENQKKFKKYHKKPTLVFYATYKKLF